MSRIIKETELKAIKVLVKSSGSRQKGLVHQNMLKKSVFLLAAAVILSSGFFGNTLINAMAETPAETSAVPYYKGIVIEEGDTLWSIATEYAFETGLSVSEYVELLKQMNGLHTDTIHAGRYLTVRYNGS